MKKEHSVTRAAVTQETAKAEKKDQHTYRCANIGSHNHDREESTM